MKKCSQQIHAGRFGWCTVDNPLFVVRSFLHGFGMYQEYVFFYEMANAIEYPCATTVQSTFTAW